MAVHPAPGTRDKLLTAEEFYRLPDPDHGGKMELIDGRVVVHMPVGRPHGRIALNVGAELRAFVVAHDLGEASVEVGHRVQRAPDTVLAPDVAFSDWARLDLTAKQGFIDVGPTLAVEVLSPDDTRREIADKVRRYFSGRVARVWVVDPKRETVTVYLSGAEQAVRRGEDVLTSGDAGFVVEGFELRVEAIFS